VDKQLIIDEFHKLYYKTSYVPTWFGFPMMKNPFDLWILQEIVTQMQPELIIECGTLKGGTTIFLASLLDLINKNGKVLSIDWEFPNKLPGHPRIWYLQGHTLEQRVLNIVEEERMKVASTMVILDDDHHKDHVLNELNIYSHIVSLNQYLVVEDTNINGHPVALEYGPGPWEAVEEFLKVDNRFVSDKDCERFGFTYNPNGYLKKIKQ